MKTKEPGEKKRRQLTFPHAIEAASAAAGGGWMGAAMQAVIAVAGRELTFTSDDVWVELDRRKVAPSGDARAMGAVMRTAATNQICKRMRGSYVQSKRKERQRGPVAVWVSRIAAESETERPQ